MVIDIQQNISPSRKNKIIVNYISTKKTAWGVHYNLHINT